MVRESQHSANTRNMSAFAVGLITIIYTRMGKWPRDVTHDLSNAFAHYGLISADSLDQASLALRFLLPGGTLLLLAFVWERNNSRSLGLSRPYFGDLLLALSAWFFYQIVFRFIVFHLYSSLTQAGPGDSALFSLPARWFITLMVLDIAYEEVATRAYVIERVISFTGSSILAGTASLVLSIGMHIPGRDIWQAFHRIPMMSMLTALYVWRRSILPGALTHLLINVGVYVLLFHFPWLLLWVFHPLPASVLFVASIVLWVSVQFIEQKLGRMGR
jgi:membrane protease YdiL (CAAX protease family)